MIFILYVKCDACGAPLQVQEDMRSQYATTGDLFIDLSDPKHPKISANCKNIQVCQENRRGIRP